MLFAAFYLALGLIYASIWFGTIDIYYIILSMIRFMLLYRERKISLQENHSERFVQVLCTYRFCGYLMLMLNRRCSVNPG